MKFYFIFFNIILLLASSLLAFMHFRHEKPIPDSILSKTPKEHDSEHRGMFHLPPPFSLASSFNYESKNLFEPSRGQTEPPPPPPPANPISERDKKMLELVGVCKINSVATAIINDKSKNAAKNKHYYQIDDKLGSGYVVAEINFNSVLLKNGPESFSITLDPKDSGSGARNQSLPAIKTGVVTSAPPPPSASKTAPNADTKTNRPGSLKPQDGDKNKTSAKPKRRLPRFFRK